MAGVVLEGAWLVLGAGPSSSALSAEARAASGTGAWKAHRESEHSCLICRFKTCGGDTRAHRLLHRPWGTGRSVSPARRLSWRLETAQPVTSDPFFLGTDVSSGGNVMVEVLTRRRER